MQKKKTEQVTLEMFLQGPIKRSYNEPQSYATQKCKFTHPLGAKKKTPRTYISATPLLGSMTATNNDAPKQKACIITSNNCG